MLFSSWIKISVVLAGVGHGAFCAGNDAAATQPQTTPVEAAAQTEVSPTVTAAPTSDEASDTEPHPLLRATLDRIGIGQWMTQNRINAFGWIEGSYNYNFSNPSPRINLGHIFDAQDGDWVINQLQINVERTVDLSSRQLDIGGRIDLLYGTDARFIHSSDFLPGDFPNPQYQFDIPQLYLDLALPVGNGLRLRIGKFEFFKFSDPNASPLFSHTFLYAASGETAASRLVSTEIGAPLPFTLTGITGYYELSRQLNLEVGVGRGYDQTLTDNNGAPDCFGRVNYTFSRQTQFSLAMITGPEITDDNSHYRTACDLGVVQGLTDDLLIIAGASYGVQARGRTLFVPKEGFFPIGGDARWYGINAAGVYRVNRNVNAAARLEWYRDEEGFTMALGRANLYEATIGLTITPFPDSDAGRGLKIRSEIRYDILDKHIESRRPIPDHSWVAAVDIIYNF